MASRYQNRRSRTGIALPSFLSFLTFVHAFIALGTVRVTTDLSIGSKLSKILTSLCSWVSCTDHPRHGKQRRISLSQKHDLNCKLLRAPPSSQEKLKSLTTTHHDAVLIISYGTRSPRCYNTNIEIDDPTTSSAKSIRFRICWRSERIISEIPK